MSRHYISAERKRSPQISLKEIAKRKKSETGIRGRAYVIGVRNPITERTYDLMAHYELNKR
jgi:hypothetical protein